MSYLRTATYSSAKAKVCKTLSHHGWDGNTCTTCGLVRDAYDAPYVPNNPASSSHPRGGVPVGSMVPIMSPLTRP